MKADQVADLKMFSINLLILIILINQIQAKPNDYLTKSKHLNNSLDNRVDVKRLDSGSIDHLTENKNQSELNNQLNDQQSTNEQRKCSQNARNSTQSSSQSTTQSTTQSAKQSATQNASQSSTADCSPAAAAVDGERPANAIKDSRAEKIKPDAQYKQARTEIKGVESVQNKTIATNSLNENAFLPHSRPESDQFESNVDNKIDKNRVQLKNQPKTPFTTHSQPFSPVTVSWTRMSQPYHKQANCIPKEVSNATYKLRYNGLSVRYYCDDRYVARGQTRLYCFQGRWTSAFPTCERKLH